MFYSLPADTVFEAKERNKRATYYLVILLILSYIFFIDFMGVIGYFLLDLWAETHLSGFVRHTAPDFGPVILYGTIGAAGLALAHFFMTRHIPLNRLLVRLKARPANPAVEAEAQFIHIVQEVEAAIGIPAIHPVILPDRGLNAFSLQGGEGRSAIGVTQGVFDSLDRNEICAVVAHEAAHLAQKDSQLTTTICFLFGVFGDMNDGLGDEINRDAYRGSTGNASAYYWIFWFLSGISYLFSNLIFVAVSRQREYLADALGVRLCKAPGSMTSGILKMSKRPGGNIPEDSAILFTVHPFGFDQDEEGGSLAEVLGTHPPLAQRLSRIAHWNHAAMEGIPAVEGKSDAVKTISK